MNIKVFQKNFRLTKLFYYKGKGVIKQTGKGESRLETKVWLRVSKWGGKNKENYIKGNEVGRIKVNR